jgi:hypothetical protein
MTVADSAEDVLPVIRRALEDSPAAPRADKETIAKF